MKKRIIPILMIILTIIITVFVFYNQSIFKKLTLVNSKINQDFKIAILLPILHPALDEIKTGFIDTFNTELKAQFKIYNANGDKILLRAQAEEIVQKGFDLIFTIATTPAIIMKEVTAQRNKFIPIVGSAVSNPVDNKIIKSMESSGNNLTVITERPDFEKQINIFLFLKPNIKKILLIYNSLSNSDLENQRQELEKILLKKNIQLTAIQILNNNEIGQKALNFVKDHDVVMVLKDNLVVSGIESLVNLCNRFKVPLYTSDLNSALKGAVLAYGIKEYDDGALAAKKAIKILKDKKSPTNVPSEFVENYKLYLNTKAMNSQNFNINENLLFLIKSAEAI